MPIQESQLKATLRHALCDQTIAIRDRKRVIEEKWLRTRRTWMGYPLSRYRSSDTETADSHIPSARRVIERAVVRGVKLLTPRVKWFEVTPTGNVDIDSRKLANIDNFMWYLIRKKIKSRSIISQLIRCLILYGMPILKTSVTVQNGVVYPTQRAVDPFSFYMYPETAGSIDEAEDIFEDFLFSYSRYQTFVNKGIVDEIREDELRKPDWPYHLVERLAYQGITDPSSNVDTRIGEIDDQLQRTTNKFVSLTEKWIWREGRLYQVYIAWNLHGGPRIVGFFESVYDEPLYRLTIHRALPSELYTTAQAEDIITLDDLQGDMFNQFINSTNREQGYLAFGGGSNARRDTFQFKGGAKWDFGADSPREVMQFIQPPVTSTNQLRAWQIINAMMQTMGGAGSIAEGQPGRNMPRAGSAVQSLIDLSMADIQDFAEITEQEVLTPGLSDIFKVTQLIPDDQLMRIPGAESVYSNDLRSNIVRKSDISSVNGEYAFEWVGSLQFQDETQRAQRLMVFLNLAPQLLPLLQEQGYTLNLPELIQTIWRNGIGERSLTKVVVTTKEMMAQQDPLMANMPPDAQMALRKAQQIAASGGSAAQLPQQNNRRVVRRPVQPVQPAQPVNNGVPPVTPLPSTTGAGAVPGLRPTAPTIPQPRSTNGFIRR